MLSGIRHRGARITIRFVLLAFVLPSISAGADMTSTITIRFLQKTQTSIHMLEIPTPFLRR